MPMPRKALGSNRFGRLTVVGPIKSAWICLCDCGTETTASGTALRRGQKTSCGCFHRERQHEATRTHGMRHSRTYTVWCNMIQRCKNPDNDAFKSYGGRGILVCEGWMQFEQFLADMGEAPSGLSIDRKNNDGDYEVDNCRWATDIEQARNTRANRNFTVSGKSQSLAAWCEESGQKYWTVHKRLRMGWTIEHALQLPL